ncbi:MAG: transcription antitermination factor NusB [Planctomycetaceae bacterium]|nr:transcription antitermination factor NusB [Planctomycetaceae bacterium]
MSEYPQINEKDDFPKGKFAARSAVRMVVFQLLYQEELNPGSREQFSDTVFQNELPQHKPLQDFAALLLNGIIEKQEEIDKAVAEVALNWTLTRMTAVDRCILRLAAYEIMFTETPKAVVINEAVELAKKFGTNESAAFVNGILDKLSVNNKSANNQKG